MHDRATIELDIAVDDARVQSETTYTWAGAHVLTIHSVIAEPMLALELHSTFVGHPSLQTHVVQLVLGPPGHEPSIAASDRADLDPTHAPRACAYEHAQRLIELLSALGHRATVTVTDDEAFAALERSGTRAT